MVRRIVCLGRLLNVAPYDPAAWTGTFEIRDGQAGLLGQASGQRAAEDAHTHSIGGRRQHGVRRHSELDQQGTEVLDHFSGISQQCDRRSDLDHSAGGHKRLEDHAVGIGGHVDDGLLGHDGHDGILDSERLFSGTGH